MQAGGATPSITRAGTAPVPRGAIENDRIITPDAVADSIRTLLSQMGVSTRNAVLGIGPQIVVTRVMDVPQVPDSELRSVLEGELAHYQILREGAGAFGHFRMAGAKGADDTPQVLMMAAEQSVIDSYSDVAERAGLTLLSLEPSLLALYRAAHPHLASAPSAIALEIGHSRAEIAITHYGNVQLYRRVDVGSDELIVGRASSRERRPQDPRMLGDEQLSGNEQEPAGAINAGAGRILVTEIQRSLDFYRREHPDAPPVARLILATNDPGLGEFGGWLSEALGLDTVIAGSPATASGDVAPAELVPPRGLAYLGAACLALRGATTLPDSIPQITLVGRPKTNPDQDVFHRALAVCLSATAAAAVITGFITLILMRNANALQLAADGRRNELRTRETFFKEKASAIEEQERQLSDLQPMGTPFPRVVDNLTSAIDAEAGIAEVGIDKVGHVTLRCETPNEGAMIRSLEGLKNCPFFTTTSLESFEWVNIAQERKVLRFTTSCQLASLNPAALATPPVVK
jgi:type IV pilus assembly protein PilM